MVLLFCSACLLEDPVLVVRSNNEPLFAEQWGVIEVEFERLEPRIVPEAAKVEVDLFKLDFRVDNVSVVKEGPNSTECLSILAAAIDTGQ